VRRLRLRHAPRIAGTRLAAVRGVALEGGGALLVNLGGRRRTVDLPVGLSCDGTLSSVWARPSARITGHPGKVDRRTRHTRGRLILPRHSVSRLSC
jgi:hypothetical protein